MDVPISVRDSLEQVDVNGNVVKNSNVLVVINSNVVLRIHAYR